MPDGREVDARSAERVHTVLGHRLTLVVAAPGWGKTTMLRALAGAVPSIEVSRPPTGWTPFSLARLLVDALAARSPAVSGEELPARPAPDSPGTPDQTAALAAAVGRAASAAVAESGAHLVVVLDDADTADDDPLQTFLEALVLHVPPRVHLLLACRRAPGLRLARLRAAGEVARLSTRDLAIGVADVGDLDPAGAAAVAEIARTTGGWPLAVHLAADVLRRAGPIDREALIDRLLARDAVLFEYLAQEVLAAATPAERELIALAAHLPHVSPPLLAALGRGDLAAALDAVADAGIFLDPPPSGDDRCRPTLVGGEFARRALPPPTTGVRRAAVGALVRLGDVEAALAVAAELGDADAAREAVLAVRRPEQLTALDTLDRALGVAESSGRDPAVAEVRGDIAYWRGEWDDALRAYDRAARLGDTAHPRLARKRGVILYFLGRLDDAQAVYAGARLDGTDEAEEAKVLSWAAAIRWIRADVDGCEELLARAAGPAAASGDDGALAAWHTTRAMAAALHGDRRTNAEEYRLALLHAERAGDPAQIVRIRTNLGSHYGEEGLYPQALAELDSAIEVAELIGSETFSALALFNRGETFLRTGRLDAALADLQRAQQIWERLGSDDVGYALTQLGDVQLLRGQRSEAVALYRQAVELAELRGNVQGLVPALVGLARALAVDEPAAAADVAERAVEAGTAVSLPHALAAAGWVALRRGRRDEAVARALEARRLGQAHQDRPAVAEALLLRAAADDPPLGPLAEEARRMWQGLGNPIGEARACLLLADTCAGRARDGLLAAADRLLEDAGAWGDLADARRARAGGAPVTVTTLGGFRVSRDGVPIEVGAWGSRKARDLVKLLVARRGAPVVRDEVAALLWPDEPDRSARRLSVQLSTIRSILDPDKAFPPDHYVAADHDTVWLVREHVEIDVERFLWEAAEGRRLLAEAEPEKAEAVLGRAASRYLGDFCADDPYADWTAGLRELARHTLVEVAAALARLTERRGEHAEAVRHRLRALDVDPYDEVAHLGLIDALVAQRRHGEARRAYRTYCARLGELDLDPAPFPS